MLPYSVTVKLRPRLFKGDNPKQWQSTATSSFSTILKANTYQYNKLLKLKGYDGHYEVSNNYTKGEPVISNKGSN